MLRRNGYLIEYEMLPYYEWKLAILSIESYQVWE